MWRSTEPRYNPETDTIDLVDSDGDVTAKLHRNAVIKMLGMLPPEPPKETTNE